MTTEKIYQEEILMPWLTRPESAGGLGWTGPAAGKRSSTAIDAKTGILWADVLTFLKGGNDANAQAWASLVDGERSARGAKDAEARAESLAKTTVLTRLDQTDTTLDLFRSALIIDGFRFSLWNRKPSTGDRQQELDQGLYQRNIRRVTPEIPVVGEPLPQQTHASLGGRAGQPGFCPKIRLDIGFHLNGIPYSYEEVKSEGSGQSAELEGRRQMAQDMVDFSIPALLRLYVEHEASEQKPWPGLGASQAKLPDVWRRRAINALPLWLGKVAWRATLDMSKTYMAPSAWDSLLKVDALLMRQRHAQHLGEAFDWGREHDALIKELMGDPDNLPPVILDDRPRSDRCGWDQPRAHMEGMLGTTGLDQETQLFGRRRKRKDVQKTDTMDLLTPRAPQRVALGQIDSWMRRMYAHESEPNWIEEDLRARLEASMPGLTQQDVRERLDERMLFRNGQDVYSIIIQGAAGVGKTHLAIWTALSLHGALEQDASGKYTSQPMYDFIVVLTDRVELRKNIAEAADTSRGSRGMVQEMETSQELMDALSGNPKQGTGRILVVNLQKFPSLREKIANGELTIKRSGGRIAFIIDEIHRSNQGKLNSQTLETFLDEMGELGAAVGVAGKKNLIVGLTATPTEPILARFGQWLPGTGIGNPGQWAPHFSYGMTQAIKDGHVLDPMQGFMRLETVLDINEDETRISAGSKKIAEDVEYLSIYEDPEYQRQTAEAFAKVFLTTTMNAIRESNKGNLVGRGKGMITMPSVKAAIGMQQAVRKALLKEAKKAKGEKGERYAQIIRDIAENRLFILYSDPGKRATVSQRADTGIDGGCSALNPLLDNAQRTEEQIIEGFRCKEAGKDGNARNSIIIVVDKLLTGFDESSLHTLMICRNLQGVGLLQAMCRVNRTRDLKDNCLVIDASYDPNGQGLGPEAKRVFQRYGGLAVSRLDGLGLYDRIIEQRIELLKHKDVQQGWRDWRKAKDEAQKMGAASLAASDIKAAKDGEATAKCLRRAIGGYLSQQRLAAPIMNLDEKDTDEKFLEYLYRLHNHLRNSGAVDDREPIQFTVRDVDFTSGVDLDHLLIQDHPDTLSPLEALATQWADGNTGKGSDSLDFDEIRKLQDAKAAQMLQFRQAIVDLCEGIELAIQAKPGLVTQRDNLVEQRVEPSEASGEFQKLLSAASVLKVDGPNGKQVLWKDLEPGRRRIVDWVKAPARLGYTMGAWLDTQRASLTT